jgi:Flp pilus assembly protein TadD
VAVLRDAEPLAVDDTRRAIRLGQAYAQVGDHQRAVEMFQRATALDPDGPEPRLNLAMAYQLLGQSAAAVKQYEQLLKNHPHRMDAANNLAWLLATDNNQAIRNPERAIRLATSVCEATHHADASYLDTLAEAHAAAGDFQSAVQVLSQAIDVAVKEKNAMLAEKLRQRRERFQSETSAN